MTHICGTRGWESPVLDHVIIKFAYNYVLTKFTYNLHIHNFPQNTSKLITLKHESYHNANFVVPGATTSCRYDNLQYHQWPQSWHYDSFRFSMFLMQRHRRVLQNQGSFYVCAQPMRDDVTMLRRFSLARHLKGLSLQNDGIISSPGKPKFGSTENQQLSWCQVCHRRWHWRL